MTEDPPNPTGTVDSDVQPSTPTEEADTTLLPEAATARAAEAATAVEDYGVTAAEEARDEPLTQRLRREVPDVPAGHRPADPERLATTGFAGRLVTDDGPHVAAADLADLTAEEAAMHLVPEQRGASTVRPRSHAERLELLEAQMTVLLAMARIHTEALQTLAEALERLPNEEPGEAADKIDRAAHEAHDLLAALREIPI